MRQSVLCVLWNPSSNQMLLIQRPREPWAYMFNFPSGPLEEGQDYQTRASEVVARETTLLIPPDSWVSKMRIHQNDHLIHVLKAEFDQFSAKPSEFGHKPVYFSVGQDLRHEPVVPALRWIVPMVFDPMVLAATVEIR